MSSPHVFSAAAGGALALACCAGCGDRDEAKNAKGKSSERGPRQELGDDLSWVHELAPGGALTYSADKVVYVVELADRKARRIGEGLFPEFSPDGSKVAWVRASGLLVANRDGGGARSLFPQMMKHGGVHWLDNESVAAVLERGKERHWYRFWLDGRREAIPELDQFGINPDRARETDIRRGEDGVWTHVAYRSWKTSDGKGGPVDGGCAVSISPDGKSITALRSKHIDLTIRPVREGGITHDLRWGYHGSFDNHRWSSNDERFLVAVEEKAKRMVLIDWRSGRAVAFGKRGHKDNTRMYGDFTNADGKAGKAMPSLLPEDKREGEAAVVERERGDPVQLDVWPYRTEGMVFLFEKRGANEFREFSGDPPTAGAGQLRDRAIYDRFGALDLRGGRFEVGGDVAETWLRRVGESREFGIEFTIRSGAGASGKVIDLGALALVQHDQELRAESGDASVMLVDALGADEPMHLLVSYADGKVSTFRDGRLVAERAAEFRPGDWGRARFEFGDGWDGGLEGVAIFSRAIAAAEAARRSELFRPRLADREPARRVTVDAELVHYTPPLPLSAMDSYRRCVSEHVFAVKSVVDGNLSSETIRVRAWSTLDMKILPEVLEGREGSIFRLTLEPEEVHPYLEQLERLNPYEGDDGFDMQGFFLVGQPREPS